MGCIRGVFLWLREGLTLSYIIMRTDLAQSPKVLRMARVCQVPHAHIVGGLFWVWSTAQTQSQDGRISTIDAETIDAQVGVPRFTEAMKLVGWLEIDPSGVSVPDFDRYFGVSAKTRAAERLKKARQRFRKWTDGGQEGDRGGTQPGQVGERDGFDTNNGTERNGTERKGTELNGTPSGGSAPRPVVPKIKDSDSTSIPEILDTPEFRAAWDEFRTHRKQIRKKLTQLAAQKQVNQFAEMGVERAIKAIEHSIRQGYTGVFEDNNHTPQHAKADARRTIAVQIPEN